MRSNSNWQQAGRVIGRPVLRFTLHAAQREPKWVLADTISLTSTQAQQPFDRLQTNKCALREIAETDAAVAKERVAAAVGILIDYLLGEGYNQEWDGRHGQDTFGRQGRLLLYHLPVVALAVRPADSSSFLDWQSIHATPGFVGRFQIRQREMHVLAGSLHCARWCAGHFFAGRREIVL